ncbi:hypothetical protein ACH5A3_08395 [Streptomyces echinatus]|uniref:hypothetical protein n=1 Tax=Streptomyces echinatus TaxID=67293 RepID=UPI0037AB0F84
MTKLRERKNNRKAVLRSLYGAVERNRPEVGGSALRAEPALPDEGLISVDWTSHHTTLSPPSRRRTRASV